MEKDTKDNARGEKIMTEALIQIEHLNKKFGDNEVLKDISAEIVPGEVVVIIGPSGSIYSLI